MARPKSPTKSSSGPPVAEPEERAVTQGTLDPLLSAPPPGADREAGPTEALVPDAAPPPDPAETPAPPPPPPSVAEIPPERLEPPIRLLFLLVKWLTKAMPENAELGELAKAWHGVLTMYQLNGRRVTWVLAILSTVGVVVAVYDRGRRAVKSAVDAAGKAAGAVRDAVGRVTGREDRSASSPPPTPATASLYAPSPRKET
mgnify:CR=1 FL=1